MEELILLFVNIRVPCAITVRHSFGIGLYFGQVLFHLSLLSLQMISLRSDHRSVQFNWNEGWRLTLVLSPARRPQS